MGEQLVAQQHRLGGLQVRLARHDDVGIGGGLVDEGLRDVGNTGSHTPERPAQPHAEKRGDLIVARAPGPQPPAQLWADTVDQPAFERAVHVLVGLRRRERTVGDVGVEPIEALEHRSEVGVGQQPRAVEHARVRPRRLDVVGRQDPVEVGGPAQRGHRLGGAVGEPTAPQGTGVGGLVLTRGHFESPPPVTARRRAAGRCCPGRAARRSSTRARATARSPSRWTDRRCRPRRRWPG